MPVSERPRKRTAQKTTNTRTIMRELNQADASCWQMLQETARFKDFLLNKELVAAGNSEEIHNNAKILYNDVLLLRGMLDRIRMNAPKEIDPRDHNQLIAALDIGNQYAEWSEQYRNTMIPTLERLGALFEEASRNLIEKNKTTGENADVQHG